MKHSPPPYTISLEPDTGRWRVISPEKRTVCGGNDRENAQRIADWLNRPMSASERARDVAQEEPIDVDRVKEEM